MQTAVGDEISWDLEYREGGAAGRFRAANGAPKSRIEEAFKSYLGAMIGGN